MSDWEGNDLIHEWQDEEIHKYTLENWNHIKKHKPTELTEREKWLLSMPKEEAIKILMAEQKEIEFPSN